MEVSSACGLQCLTMSPHSNKVPSLNPSEGLFFVAFASTVWNILVSSPVQTHVFGWIGTSKFNSETWWYCLLLYIHPGMSWWLVQACTPPLAHLWQLIVGFSPYPHRDQRNVLSPQQLERCWSLLHGGKVKVETAKWTADKSIFYSICHVPFSRQVKEHKIKSGQWNVFIHSCTLRVSHYRVRSENPDWNQIIPAAPQRRPTHHWKRRDCEQQCD